jgi:integrase
MSRITKPLTDKQIKQAKPKDKEYNLADGNGLQLRVKPSGSKLWLFNYARPYTKKRTNLGFGAYPDVSLSSARELRAQARELLAKDIDPKEHKDNHNRQQKAAHGNTLKFVTDSWVIVKKSQVSEDHANDIYRSFELHIFPKLGNYPIHKLKASLVIDAFQPIHKNGNNDLVKRLCQRINEVMNYAVNTGLCDNNPLTGITKAFKAPSKSHYPTIKPEELFDFTQAIKKAEIQPLTRALIFWQLHTMVRPSEAAGTRWNEIDFENKLWHIPAERMKKKKAHTVPLTDEALEVIGHLKGLTGHHDHVFHSARTASKHLNESTVNTVLKRNGYKGKMVAHGMRALASTTLNEAGFDHDVIESALAHVDKNEVRAAYNRAEYIERRKVMMDWWSKRITGEVKEKIKVVSINANL